MCSYKVVKVFFEVWGLQGRVESGVHRVSREGEGRGESGVHRGREGESQVYTGLVERGEGRGERGHRVIAIGGGERGREEYMYSIV